MGVPGAASVLASGSHCIGCPGGGANGTGAIIVGIALVLAGVAALVISQRRAGCDRQRDPSPRAASVAVTLGRALGVLAVLIGLLTVILQP